MRQIELETQTYIIKDFVEKSYEGNTIYYLKVKQYHQVYLTVPKKSYTIVVLHRHLKTLNIKVGELVDLYSNQFYWIKGNIFKTTDNFKNIVSYPTQKDKTNSITNQGSDNTSKITVQADKQKRSSLPSSISYNLSWELIAFDSGHINVRSPYASYGGLGKRIKWEKSSVNFEQIKPLLSVKIPFVKAKISNGNIVDILNVDEIKESIINLSKPVRRNTEVRISRPRSRIKAISRPRKMNLDSVKNLPVTKSSLYMKMLCGLHLIEMPVYYCLETKDTLSGTASPENAFIFCLKKTKRRMLIIYENVLEARSSYLFVINNEGYSGTIYKIYSFFASDRKNKRENMALECVDFKTDNIESYQRIFHTNLHEWKVGVMKQIDSLI